VDSAAIVGGGVLGLMPAVQERACAPGVVLLTGPGGCGMTCSPVIAEETFQRAAQEGQP
jgi:hypothetical protein